MNKYYKFSTCNLQNTYATIYFNSTVTLFEIYRKIKIFKKVLTNKNLTDTINTTRANHMPVSIF